MAGIVLLALKPVLLSGGSCSVTVVSLPPAGAVHLSWVMECEPEIQ